MKKTNYNDVSDTMVQDLKVDVSTVGSNLICGLLLHIGNRAWSCGMSFRLSSNWAFIETLPATMPRLPKGVLG